jgi:alpha-D-ribose 1-methylphosphonate 5-triphosphate synthase subunit PhnG
MIARLSDAEITEMSSLVVDRSDVVVLDGPTVGMIMARAIEGAYGEMFNVGEVLVTECRVQVEGRDGWVMLQGSRPSAALGAATIDAALEAGRADRAAVDTLLGRLIASHDAEIAARQADLAATRVQFETQ